MGWHGWGRWHPQPKEGGGQGWGQWYPQPGWGQGWGRWCPQPGWVGLGCRLGCSAHGCPQDEADFKDKLSPVALSLSLALSGGTQGLVLYGDTLVQAQVGGDVGELGTSSRCPRVGSSPRLGQGTCGRPHSGAPTATAVLWLHGPQSVPSGPNPSLGHSPCPLRCPQCFCGMSPLPPPLSLLPPWVPHRPHCSPGMCPLPSLLSPTTPWDVPSPLSLLPPWDVPPVPLTVPSPSLGCPLSTHCCPQRLPILHPPLPPSHPPPARPTSYWRTAAMTTSASPTSAWPPTRELPGG